MSNDGISEAQTAMQLGKLITDSAIVGVQLTKIIADTIISESSAYQDRKIADGLMNGKSDAVFVDVSDAGSIRKALSEKGVPFRIVYYGGERGLTAAIVFDGKNRQDVLDAVEERNIDLRHVREVFPEAYYTNLNGLSTMKELDSYAGGRVSSVANTVSEDRAIMFARRAREIGAPVYIEGPADGNYRIFFADRDARQMARIKTEVAKDFSSKSLPYLQKELEWRSENSSEIMKKAIRDKRYETLEIGSVFMSDDGQSLEVTRSAFVARSEDGRVLQRIPRHMETPKNEQAVRCFIAGMRCPVYLSADQAKEYQSTSRKREYLLERQHEAGRPKYTEEEIRKIAEADEMRHLYENRLMRELPEMRKIPRVSLNIDSSNIYGFSGEEKTLYEEARKEYHGEKEEISDEEFEKFYDELESYSEDQKAPEFSSRAHEDEPEYERSREEEEQRENDAFEQDAEDVMDDPFGDNASHSQTDIDENHNGIPDYEEEER